MTEAIIFMIGLIAGIFLCKVSSYRKLVGDLRVDTSDEEPYLFLELSEPLDTVLKKKRVTLQVVIKDYISHK